MPHESSKQQGFIQSPRRLRILAVASGGGHWVQLLRVKPAFDGHELTFVTVLADYRGDVENHQFFVVRDGTRWNKVGLLLMAAKLMWIVMRVRPQIVISTGAAPGFFAIRIGKLFGAKTIWIDSIANVEQLSMAGQHVGKNADLWLTQWEHLACAEGPRYEGSVL